ncbi:hypothetical protein DFH09DRAFT_264234 [Mycena vulgaris]|nr:hypothetical protein DFH09DRAFT_264234 [Mycena vulgaris]
MSDPSSIDANSVDPLTAAIQQVQRPYALKVLALCSSPHSAHDSTRAAPIGPWRHVSELEYIGPTHPSAAMWNDFAIITYLVHTAITIPPRSDSRSDPWVVVTSNDSGSTTLPRGYRVPLLWLTKVQWESLKLLLTVARPLWDTIKFDLLYIARLTTQFLAKARNEPRIKRQWRDPMFDRAMTRFFNGWMGCRDVFLWDFHREFREEEYKDDLLARRWAQKVPKGIQGFVITEQELIDGLTADQLQAGLILNRDDSTFGWAAEPEVEHPPSDPPISPARRKEDEAAPGSASRGSSPLTSEMGSDIEMIAESLNPKTSEASTPVPPTPTLSQKGQMPLVIQTGSELQRKKSHKAKPRTKTDRPEKASRPLRTRTMSGSISAMSPATPKVAQLGHPNLSLPGSSASSPNRTPSGFDFTAPVESRGRKRKIESIYSISPSPLTSDSEDDSSGKGSKASREPKNPSRPTPRPVQNATPDGRAFSTNSRIVIPRLANPEVYSKPTTEAYSAAPVEVPHPIVKPVRTTSASESSSPRKAKAPIVPLHHYKLYAISSSPSTNPFDPQNPATTIPPFPTWRHPDELEYIGPNHPSAASWTDLAILTYMVDNAFTIPSRNADNKVTWVEVKNTDRNGTVSFHETPARVQDPTSLARESSVGLCEAPVDVGARVLA